MFAQKLVHDDFQKTAQQLLTIPHLLPDYSLPTARQLPTDCPPQNAWQLPDDYLIIN